MSIFSAIGNAFGKLGDTVTGGLLSGATSVANGFINANQASKDRKFQERMYQKQYDDQIAFWNMQNDYNLPSAQMQRLKDANLNPYLMYGEGASGLTAQGSVNAAVPGGTTSRRHVQFDPQMFMALKDLKNRTEVAKSEVEKNRAESALKDADAALKRSQTTGQDNANEFYQLTRDLEVNIKSGNYRLINSTIQQIDNSVLNSNRITDSQLATMAQAREYEVKRFNLQDWQVGESIKQKWEDIKNGRVVANAQNKSAVAAMLNAVNNARFTDAEIGKMAAEVREINSRTDINGEQRKNLIYERSKIILGNKLIEVETDLKKAELSNMYNFGSKDVPMGRLYKEIAPWVFSLLNSVGFYY